MKYKVGSLFAGVGQAFKNSNCDVIWANEIDEKACITYELNHKDTNVLMTLPSPKQSKILYQLYDSAIEDGVVI